MKNQNLKDKKNRLLWAAGISLVLLLTGLVTKMELSAETDAGEITVYKTRTCGCCVKWIDHLREAGFKVTAVDHDDLGGIKSMLGVRPDFQSCHTALVDGYVIEGHVPAGDIKRLLREKPDMTGLTLPGMPMGSPGMEMDGHMAHTYQVLSFDENGQTEIFARH